MKHCCIMLISLALVMNAVTVKPTLEQKDANEQIPVYSYRQLGSYRLIDDAPVEFREFKEIIVRFKKGVNPHNAKLNPDGNLATRGHLYTSQRKYVFAHSIVGVEEKRLRSLTFKTVAINGISYSFNGRFPYPPRFDESIRHFIGLEGTLTKYRRGSKIAEANLELGHYIVE